MKSGAKTIRSDEVIWVGGGVELVGEHFSFSVSVALRENKCLSQGVCFHPTPLQVLYIILLLIILFCKF